MHFTLKTNPLKRSDLDDFVECYHPTNRHRRKATFSESNPDSRWRSFDYDDLLKRDKVNLDLFWLKDESLEGSDDLPPPDVLTQEVADDLQSAMELFSAIAEKLKG
jgi:type I restriction enzyme M protein